MKVFAGFMLGGLMAVSMMYGYFGFFVLTLVAGFFLWASTQPRLMDDDDKKSAGAANTRADK